MRVREEEAEGYEATLTGIYGEENKLKAQRLGLRGIVEQVRRYVREGVVIKDLLTEEVFWRGHIKAEKLMRGDRIVQLDPTDISSRSAAAPGAVEMEHPNGTPGRLFMPLRVDTIQGKSRDSVMIQAHPLDSPSKIDTYFLRASMNVGIERSSPEV